MATEQTDPSFVQFKTPAYGIRALVKTLDTYQRDHHLMTVRAIIDRWAPPNENDTDAYVRAVADACHVKPDEMFVLGVANMRNLVKAIIQHENGLQPYADSVIDQGIEMARA